MLSLKSHIPLVADLFCPRVSLDETNTYFLPFLLGHFAQLVFLCIVFCGNEDLVAFISLQSSNSFIACGSLSNLNKTGQ